MKASFRHLAWIWVLLCCDVSGQSATYTVKPGDSLSKIARGQNCSVEALAKANGIKLSAIIQPGQILKVPGKAEPSATGGSHTIQPGDTFSSISRQYGVSVESLLAVNPDLNPRSLKPGQKIRLAAPAKSVASETEPAPTAASNAREAESSAPSPAKADAEKANPSETTTEDTPSTQQGQIQTVMVDEETTFGEFAAKYGTDIQRLNELNGLDLTEATVLAKGSELYVPTQP